MLQKTGQCKKGPAGLADAGPWPLTKTVNGPFYTQAEGRELTGIEGVILEQMAPRNHRLRRLERRHTHKGESFGKYRFVYQKDSCLCLQKQELTWKVIIKKTPSFLSKTWHFSAD